MKEMDKTVKPEDLRVGDIILLSPCPGSTESKLIGILTKSKVTHTIMVYYDKEYVIEQNEPQVQINNLRQKSANRTAYVVRHTDEALDTSKVIDVAKKYYDEKLPYMSDNVYFMAVYFLIADIGQFLSIPLQALVTRLFKIGMSELMKIYDEKKYGTIHCSTCAQFAYDCYREAGEAYAIKVDHSLENETLIQQIEHYRKHTNGIREEEDLAEERATLEEKEELLRNIYEELSSVDHSCQQNGITRLSEELLRAASQFLDQYVRIFRENGKENASSLMEELEGYLMVPEDLLHHCKNLKCIGILAL